MFLFDKRTADKLHKPRRKETISEMLRHGVRQLERCRHPRLLHVLHSVEETPDTLAFATEPVAFSLGNVFASTQEDKCGQSAVKDAGDAEAGSHLSEASHVNDQPGADHVKATGDLPFLDIEIKYGIFQVSHPCFVVCVCVCFDQSGWRMAAATPTSPLTADVTSDSIEFPTRLGSARLGSALFFQFDLIFNLATNLEIVGMIQSHRFQ